MNAAEAGEEVLKGPFEICETCGSKGYTTTDFMLCGACSGAGQFIRRAWRVAISMLGLEGHLRSARHKLDTQRLYTISRREESKQQQVLLEQMAHNRMAIKEAVGILNEKKR